MTFTVPRVGDRRKVALPDGAGGQWDIVLRHDSHPVLGFSSLLLLPEYRVASVCSVPISLRQITAKRNLPADVMLKEGDMVAWKWRDYQTKQAIQVAATGPRHAPVDWSVPLEVEEDGEFWLPLWTFDAEGNLSPKFEFIVCRQETADGVRTLSFKDKSLDELPPFSLKNRTPIPIALFQSGEHRQIIRAGANEDLPFCLVNPFGERSVEIVFVCGDEQKRHTVRLFDDYHVDPVCVQMEDGETMERVSLFVMAEGASLCIHAELEGKEVDQRSSPVVGLVPAIKQRRQLPAAVQLNVHLPRVYVSLIDNQPEEIALFTASEIKFGLDSKGLKKAQRTRFDRAQSGSNSRINLSVESLQIDDQRGCARYKTVLHKVIPPKRIRTEDDLVAFTVSAVSPMSLVDMLELRSRAVVFDHFRVEICPHNLSIDEMWIRAVQSLFGKGRVTQARSPDEAVRAIVEGAVQSDLEKHVARIPDATSIGVKIGTLEISGISLTLNTQPGEPAAGSDSTDMQSFLPRLEGARLVIRSLQAREVFGPPKKMGEIFQNHLQSNVQRALFSVSQYFVVSLLGLLCVWYRLHCCWVLFLSLPPPKCSF